jgi:uncharacterized membrane protein YdbT with pleckstrin-like domain
MQHAQGTGPPASEPIRVVRPVVVPAQFLVVGPLVAGFLALFPGFFTLVLSNIIASFTLVLGDRMAGRFEPVLGPALVVFALAFVAILALFGLKVFCEPGRTSYAIYPDRIEFEEGLLNRQRRTVLLDKIIDVQLTEGVLQRTAGAGTITLVTQQLVSEGEGRLSNRTFRLGNVPDPGGLYELVRSLALGGQGAKSSLPE